ncbi:hypothetical protein LZ554_000377 [Drepanopeziza brunnea f. sp. 'monogermtubi']|nr:hypothetical protein LZ554_000377 [Drepanopeziza brunnea f. sp. 'monogermtubi']
MRVGLKSSIYINLGHRTLGKMSPSTYSPYQTPPGNEKYHRRDEMLGLAVEPPPSTRPGLPLYPPVAARISSETDIYGELAQTWAVATLIRYSGENQHNQLGGKAADSAHPLSDSSSSGARRDRAYFYFPDLFIDRPGRYKIRISLMKMDYSCDEHQAGVARVLEYVDSRTIIVEDGSNIYYRPSGRERAFLRILKSDGQPIPSAPA